MKTKTGTCIDCGPGSSVKPLIAGRCQSHYWKHRQHVNARKPAAKAKQALKDDLTGWFNMQLATAPNNCENCCLPLRESMLINPRAIVCHIVSKSLFPEVAIHPLNRWFGCNDCHTWYDANPGEINHMPVFPVVLARFQRFRDGIRDANLYMIPDPLK